LADYTALVFVLLGMFALFVIMAKRKRGGSYADYSSDRYSRRDLREAHQRGREEANEVIDDDYDDYEEDRYSRQVRRDADNVTRAFENSLQDSADFVDGFFGEPKRRKRR